MKLFRPSLFVAASTLCVIATPAFATTVTGTGATAVVRTVDRRFSPDDPCRIYDELKEQERCRARNLNKTVDRFPKIDDAFSNRIDSYRRKVQEQEYQDRLKEMLAKRRATPTWREKIENNVEDINTQRLPYIKDTQKAMYDCMMKPVGRQRSQCLDEAKSNAHKQVIERRKIPKVINIDD